MPASSLLRFVNPEIGPVVSITSTPYPDLLSRWIWQSTAQLHPDCGLSGAQLKVFEACGGGWSKDKEQSQCKAVTEALERWAYRHYYHFFQKTAALDIDPTSNGFAALPYSLGETEVIINAYCEALERWILNRIWDHGDLELYKIPAEENSIAKLFAGFKGKLHCLGMKLQAYNFDQIPPLETFFNLCVFETETGGVIPGSACGKDSQAAMERALLETFINVTAFDLMKKRNLTAFDDILEQRLYHFGNSNQGYPGVEKRILRSDARPFSGTPKVIFSKRLAGLWEPEVLVHRVLVDGSMPVTEGGMERFVI
ncbi:MAG: YcaO-like family protein [Elusimicrobiota bacterium]